MHDYLYRFGIDCARWFVKIICGGVEIRTIYVGAKQAKACLISRFVNCNAAFYIIYYLKTFVNVFNYY